MKRIMPAMAFIFFFICKEKATAQTVIIGTQTWATKNLEVTTFRNGDAIGEAKTAAEWASAAEQRKPAWCYYDNDVANGKKYGKLYNWFAVSDPRGLAPKGWHGPSDAEWVTLTGNLGGENAAGTQMKNGSGWKDNGNGSNTSGFEGLPGGWRSLKGVFADGGAVGYWWSSTKAGPYSAWYRMLSSDKGVVGRAGNGFMKAAYSVRCVAD
jgi:uncharacterized protein (TIGR02145 family)